MYEEKTESITKQLDTLETKIANTQNDRPPLAAGLDIARAISNAAQAFRKEAPQEQRRLLTTTL